MACDSLKIYICDDDASMRETLAVYSERMCAILGIPCECRAFSDGDELVGAFDGSVDILLLDVEMPILNGMDAAREIRAANDQVSIVFTTSFERYAIAGYEVGAYRYLLKPISFERFASELSEAFKRAFDAKASKLYVKAGAGMEAVSFSDIVCVETGKSHRVSIVTRTRELEVYESMARIEAELAGGDFFRCHESYIVGFRHVMRVGANELVLADGRTVPISRHRKKAFMEAFSQFACTETMLGANPGAREG